MNPELMTGAESEAKQALPLPLHTSVSSLSLSSSAADDEPESILSSGRSSSNSSVSSSHSSDRLKSLNVTHHRSTLIGRSHNRSVSALDSHNSLPMTRTKSLPLERSSTFFSPAYTVSRPRSPLKQPVSRLSPRQSFDESHPTSSFTDIEIIAEDSELDLSQRPSSASSRDQPTPATPMASLHSNTLSRGPSRRRPTSPLAQQANASSSSQGQPQSPAVKFNESFPTSFYSTTSSNPSTPTSFRSRSPSIASLETIPDTPTAVEAEAEKEADDLARMKAEADSDSDENSSQASDRSAGRFGRDKRKRWSVCGAERRGDFEMETIWED